MPDNINIEAKYAELKEYSFTVEKNDGAALSGED